MTSTPSPGVIAAMRYLTRRNAVRVLTNPDPTPVWFNSPAYRPAMARLMAGVTPKLRKIQPQPQPYQTP